MTARVLHVSDLHAGAHDEERDEVEEALRALAARLEPELVVASGDLTHRNRRAQHERAATFLRSLGPPVLAVPGNHDIPALPPRRLVHPFRAFEDTWGRAEPVYRSETVVACGVNSVRPWLYQEGLVRRSQLERVERTLSEAPDRALRVVVLHHHLVSAPWRTAKRPVFRRARVLGELAEAGAELVLSGHVHQSVVVEQREFLSSGGTRRSLVVAVAPGLGRPRPGRTAEASGLHVCEADAESLRVLTYMWADGGFELVARRDFPRVRG